MVATAVVSVNDTQKCDRDDCEAEATQGYLWAWGEKGVCCSLHSTLLQQVAGTIDRTVTLHPLQRATPAPLLRDERIRLQALSLTLEAELEEAKSRGLELYRINEQLRGENRLLKVREAEAGAQLQDAHAYLEELRETLQQREAESANLVMENERLKTLEAFTSERGLEGARYSSPVEPVTPGGDTGGNVVD